MITQNKIAITVNLDMIAETLNSQKIMADLRPPKYLECMTGQVPNYVQPEPIQCLITFIVSLAQLAIVVH